jgi:hypothetical protein
MSEDPPDAPEAPDLPKYLQDPLESQPPEKLDQIAEYARELAGWKRRQRERKTDQKRNEEKITPEKRDALEERDVSTDPGDYDDVPASRAYITIKETKPGYRYYYWQWREGDTWKNEYIGPVSPKE